MKKKPINNVLNTLIELIIGFFIMISIASIFSECTNKKPDKHTVEMQITHSDKGLVTEENGLIIIKR